jgi:hypothetical protein
MSEFKNNGLGKAEGETILEIVFGSGLQIDSERVLSFDPTPALPCKIKDDHRGC